MVDTFLSLTLLFALANVHYMFKIIWMWGEGGSESHEQAFWKQGTSELKALEIAHTLAWSRSE